MIINPAFNSELKTARSFNAKYIQGEHCFYSVLNVNFHGQFEFKFDLLVQKIAFCFDRNFYDVNHVKVHFSSSYWRY